MCGIIGIYGLNKDKYSRLSQVKQMTSSLAHRGPDGWGYYISSQIGFGQTRLSIVDLSTGDQPMKSGKYVIVFNGEIYNYIELKNELRKSGITFQTTSDTEVLLKAFEHWGTKCFSLLNGQFAVLIWNTEEEILTIARDRFGIRPLYLIEFQKNIFFSSELKAFDQIEGYQREYDFKRLYEHALFWNTYGDHTVYKNIKSLPGGTFAIFSRGKIIQQNKFYEIGSECRINGNSLSQVTDDFKELMDDSVKLRLRSDVPVGAYLSGGIDSSVILHLIRNHNKKHFKTFSVTFSDQEYDESEYQMDMVRSIDSDHYPINITYKKVDEAFPDAVYHFERPVFRTAPVPLFLLSEEVRKTDIKVVLTGEGADEILWGYDSFKEMKLLQFWSRFPDSSIRPQLIKKLYPHLNHYSDSRQFGMMKMFYEGFFGSLNNELASLNIRMQNNQIMQNYFHPDRRIKLEKETIIEEIRTWLPRNYNDFTLLQKSQYLEMKTLLAGYLLSSQGDRMSLAHGIEGRYPFLDHRVVDFLFSINERFKLNGFDQKYLLKKAYYNDIPSSIVNRPKRPYMSPDLRSFIIDDKLTKNASFFLDQQLIRDYGIFNYKWVDRFLSKFQNGIPRNIGYRDNMIITFILSAQIAQYWAKNPRKFNLPDKLLTVAINDY